MKRQNTNVPAGLGTCLVSKEDLVVLQENMELECKAEFRRKAPVAARQSTGPAKKDFIRKNIRFTSKMPDIVTSPQRKMPTHEVPMFKGKVSFVNSPQSELINHSD